jgi:type VI secretion system VasD/TssJ family lipoprotein
MLVRPGSRRSDHLSPQRGARSARPLVSRTSWTALFVLSLLGCSAKSEIPAPAPPPPVYTLCLDASPRLNWWDGRANSLAVRVFYLSSLDGFRQIDPARLFDKQVVLPGMEGGYIDQTVYPEGRLTIQIPFNPSARYIGLAAGYFQPDPRGSVRMFREFTLDGRSGMGQCVKLGSNSIEAS